MIERITEFFNTYIQNQGIVALIIDIALLLITLICGLIFYFKRFKSSPSYFSFFVCLWIVAPIIHLYLYDYLSI